MFGFVKVAVGDVRVMFETRHREQVVAIRGFPDVDEVRQLVPVIPQIAGADLDPPRRPVARVAGDAEAPADDCRGGSLRFRRRA